MISRRLFAAAGLAAVFIGAQGCGYYSSKPEDENGLTDAQLKKMMEDAKDAKPTVLETTAEETIELLTDPETADGAAKVLKEFRRRVVGKVLERCPDNSVSLFVILDGGTHKKRAYKVWCTFAADQREAVKQIKAGDEVRLEGASDSVLKEDTLELTNCVFASAAKSAAAPPAKP